MTIIVGKENAKYYIKISLYCQHITKLYWRIGDPGVQDDVKVFCSCLFQEERLLYMLYSQSPMLPPPKKILLVSQALHHKISLPHMQDTPSFALSSLHLSHPPLCFGLLRWTACIANLLRRTFLVQPHGLLPYVKLFKKITGLCLGREGYWRQRSLSRKGKMCQFFQAAPWASS